MRDEALEQFWSRIRRVSQLVRTAAAEGHEELRTLDDGTVHRYKITGVKSPDQLEDELSALFVWAWSLKDYLKRAARNRGADDQFFENLVNGCRSLQLIGDIANGVKHGGLRKSRSGGFPVLVNVGFTVPQAAISGITIGVFDVGIDVKDSTAVDLHAQIRLKDGTLLDAFEVLDEGLKAWEVAAQGNLG